MKIAFVNQPIDTIIPPNQNSVGACTYWVARSLAKSAEVVVYGIADNHADPAALAQEPGIDFRFFQATRRDEFLFNLQKKFAKLFARSTPISTSKWLYPDYGRQVAADLQQQDCDVIHLQQCSQYAPLIRALNPRAKIVLHLHTELFSQSNPAVIADRLKAIDLVTTVGNYVTEKTKLTFPELAGRCETTYNGIDAREFAREKDYASSRRRQVKRILYSGAVSPHKGLHVLLKAFVLVSRKDPDVLLEIAGAIGNYPLEENFDLRDEQTIREVSSFYATPLWSLIGSKFTRKPPEKGSYFRYLKASLPGDLADRVSFLGMQQWAELVERYYTADIFAFAPIWNEGFGLPPVEAMAAGLPVVASRSGTVVETVIEGKTGILVDKNDPEQLANALLLLLNDEDRREAMGRAGRLRALEQFSWDNIAKGMYARYRTLCSGAVPSAVQVHSESGCG
jgi:glycosyltransferase involved in cell wall biosynthesis